MKGVGRRKDLKVFSRMILLFFGDEKHQNTALDGTGVGQVGQGEA